jgi:hypothetical protein
MITIMEHKRFDTTEKTYLRPSTMCGLIDVTPHSIGGFVHI